MHRLGILVVLTVAVACERSNPSTSPEPTPTVATVEPEPQPEPEIEPESEPEPEPEPEISKIDEPVFSKNGFEARKLKCELAVPMRGADGYIAAGLADADADLDACAPKGAAIDVTWQYVSGQALNVKVSAPSSTMAKCVSTAMAKVRAGVEASCSAVLLIGDPAGAAAAYEAR